MKIRYLKEREEIIKFGKKIVSSALTVGTWGNISLRLSEGNLMAITPSGMEYDQLKPDDIVILDLNGNRVEGEKKPSIEYPLHSAIYRARKDIKAIIHTHSTYATAMATARKSIPGCVEDLVQIVGGNVRVSNYALPGTEELGKNVVQALVDRNGVLIANHGALGAGRDLGEALKICQLIEKGALVTIAAQAVGGVIELEQKDIKIMRDFYLHSYGQR